MHARMRIHTHTHTHTHTPTNVPAHFHTRVAITTAMYAVIFKVVVVVHTGAFKSASQYSACLGTPVVESAPEIEIDNREGGGREGVRAHACVCVCV